MRLIMKNENGITVVLSSGQPKMVGPDHTNYGRLVRAAKEGDEESFVSLLDESASLVLLTEGQVAFDGENLTFNGQNLEHSMVSRLRELVRAGFDVEPMLKFLSNLMENPSAQSVRCLHQFLEQRNMPITEDGHFLAYKGLRADYTDGWTGKIDNSIGQVVEMPRNFVDDSRELDCSFGYHVGTLKYATGFKEITVIVKVNPRDVVSVPSNTSSWKIRVCRYEVIQDYERPMNDTVYSDDVEEVEAESQDFFEPDELFVGDEIKCYYTNADGENKMRHVLVTEDNNDSYLIVRLLEGEENEGEHRRFIKSRMSKIVLINEQ